MDSPSQSPHADALDGGGLGRGGVVDGQAGQGFLERVPLGHGLAGVVQHLDPVVAAQSDAAAADGEAAHHLVGTHPGEKKRCYPHLKNKLHYYIMFDFQSQSNSIC